MVEGFGIWDYVSFSLLSVLSIGIGIYHTWKERKSNSLDDYFLASRRMGVLPVALSSFATSASATMMLGVPAESYFYADGSFFLSSLASFSSSIAVVWIIVPVLYNLQVTSIYEFLEKRFHVSVQRLAAFCYLLSTVFGCGVVVYGTAIGIIEITRLSDDIWMFGFLICLSASVYTILGGLRAVIWADVVQSVIMYSALLALMVKSCIDIGGFAEVIRRIKVGSRFRPPNPSVDPTIRFTVWSCTIGFFFSRLVVTSASQMELQRLLATKSLKNALRAGVGRAVVLSSFYLLAQVTGLFMYAYYWTCDPLTEKRITSQNKMVPLFLVDVLKSTPGLCGLMVAGIFSSSVSTLSSAVNSLAAVSIKDFLKPIFPKMSVRTTLWLSKLLALFFGCVSVFTMQLSFAFPNVIQAAFSISFSLFGCIFGTMILGMAFPRCNARSAFIGTLAALCFWMWLLVGQLTTKWQYPYLPLSTNSCNTTFESNGIVNSSLTTQLYGLTSSNVTAENFRTSTPLWINRVSYYWHALIYVTVTVVVGLLISLISKNERKMDDDFMPAVVHRIYKVLPRKIQVFFGYIQDALEDVDLAEKIQTNENLAHMQLKNLNCATPFLGHNEPKTHC